MAKRRSVVNLFLDSSVLFTAVNSSFGGSAKLFTLENVRFYVSRIVLHEVEKNVRKKLGEMYVERFLRLVEQVQIMRGLASEGEVKRAQEVIVVKDSVILADFKRSKCSHLITLDKRDFLQEKVLAFVKPKRVITPKMWFEEN